MARANPLATRVLPQERTMRRKSKKEAKRREREREEEEQGKGQEGGHYVNLGRSRVFVRDNSVRTTEV